MVNTTPKNTPASDEKKAKKYVEREFPSCEDDWNNLEFCYRAGLREARTESRAEIAQLRQLLDRAKNAIGTTCRCSGVSDDDCDECEFRADYAALTKGEKND